MAKRTRIVAADHEAYARTIPTAVLAHLLSFLDTTEQAATARTARSWRTAAAMAQGQTRQFEIDLHGKSRLSRRLYSAYEAERMNGLAILRRVARQLRTWTLRVQTRYLNARAIAFEQLATDAQQLTTFKMTTDFAIARHWILDDLTSFVVEPLMWCLPIRSLQHVDLWACLCEENGQTTAGLLAVLRDPMPALQTFILRTCPYQGTLAVSGVCAAMRALTPRIRHVQVVVGDRAVDWSWRDEGGGRSEIVLRVGGDACQLQDLCCAEFLSAAPRSAQRVEIEFAQVGRQPWPQLGGVLRSFAPRQVTVLGETLTSLKVGGTFESWPARVEELDLDLQASESVGECTESFTALTTLAVRSDGLFHDDHWHNDVAALVPVGLQTIRLVSQVYRGAEGKRELAPLDKVERALADRPALRRIEFFGVYPYRATSSRDMQPILSIDWHCTDRRQRRLTWQTPRDDLAQPWQCEADLLARLCSWQGN